MGFGIGGKEHHGKRIDTGYVSEFGRFMEHFLEEHPEEIAERIKGRSLYWDLKVDPATLDRPKDTVPDDRYGFDSSAWLAAKRKGSPGRSR